VLKIQQELAEKIAEYTAPLYTNLIEPDYGKLAYRKLLKWEGDYSLEQQLFTKHHLSEIDFTALKKILRTR
jgi:hypothetical protein